MDPGLTWILDLQPSTQLFLQHLNIHILRQHQTQEHRHDKHDSHHIGREYGLHKLREDIPYADFAGGGEADAHCQGKGDDGDVALGEAAF